MSGNKWKIIREELKKIMKTEVSLMRELLANMHQEELHLLFGEKGEWKSLIEERSHLYERLGNLKTARLHTIKELRSMLPPMHKTETLQQFLSLDDESCEEIRLLKDQFSALLKRAHFQNKRNTHLKSAKEYIQREPQATHYATLKLYKEEQKKKSGVITCEKEDL